MDIILGIDPGIADTGYGLIQTDKNNKLHCLDFGSIRTKANLGLPDRLEKLAKDLDLIIKKYRPQIVAVEDLFFCRNVKTALTVGHARGVILLTIKKNKLPLLEFTPLQVKQAVSTYGRASKSQVQEMVKLILGLKTIPKPDDAADALAVAICGLNSL